MQGGPTHGANKVSRNSLPAELGVFGFFAFFALIRSCLTEKSLEKSWVKNTTVLTQFLPANSLGVGVEAEEDTLVDQWVLVLGPRTLGDLGVGRSDNGLNHGAVDDASDIGVGDLGRGETEKGQQRGREHRWANSHVVFLVDGCFIKGAEDLIEESESALGPDNESAEVAARSKLE